jgi:hypothetical protein
MMSTSHRLVRAEQWLMSYSAGDWNLNQPHTYRPGLVVFRLRPQAGVSKPGIAVYLPTYILGVQVVCRKMNKGMADLSNLPLRC